MSSHVGRVARTRIFNSIYDNPPIVSSSMSRAMHIVDAGFVRIEERLPIGEDSRPCGRGDHAVQFIVGDHLDELSAVIRKREQHGQDLVRTVASSTLRM